MIMDEDWSIFSISVISSSISLWIHAWPRILSFLPSVALQSDYSIYWATLKKTNQSMVCLTWEHVFIYLVIYLFFLFCHFINVNTIGTSNAIYLYIYCHNLINAVRRSLYLYLYINTIYSLLEIQSLMANYHNFKSSLKTLAPNLIFNN